MSIENGNYDESLYPTRKPWILVVVLVIVAGILIYKFVPWNRISAPAVDNRQRDGQLVPVRIVAAANPPVKEIESDGQKRIQPANATRAALTADMPRAREISGAVRPDVSDPVAGGRPTSKLSLEQARLSLAKAQSLEAGGSLLEARKTCLELLASCQDERIVASCMESLSRVNISLVLAPQPMPEKTAYVVQKNDAIERIARKFGTTKELVAKGNNLGSASVIHPGQTLKILKGRFSISISKHNYEMIVRLNGEFFKKYGVGLGMNNKTATGVYTITDRQVDPTWWPAGSGPIAAGDQRNLLGTRWLAIKDRSNPGADNRGLGIHGTRDDSSIGKSLSAGCVRMKNTDVEELHVLVPIGTPVEITE